MGELLIEIKSKDQLKEIIGKPTLSVVHFQTPWAPIVKSTHEMIVELAASPELKNVVFAAVDAEGFNGEISLQYNVSCVPTVLFFKTGRVIDRIDGVHPADVAKKVMTHANQTTAEPISIQNNVAAKTEKKGTMEDRLKQLVNRHKVMIFMKGNPETPRCGFSRTLISMMQETGVPYDTFDILEDEEVRQSLKTFSNWHTYPQVYVNGQLVGGLDIIKDIKESGELMATLES